ncbi:hypothetical protein SAMN04488553_2302 [Gramella sp. MAR_2010_147]|nr:hypothetical protein SAMN04488553_2302 [Gramella sp. MAR_2010_147]
MVFPLDSNTIEMDFRQNPETFDWIIGDWIRTNGMHKLTTTEHWKKISSNLYEGTGVTKKNNETVFRENLRIIKKEEKWIYEVTGVNKETTNFLLTSISDNTFTAVNPENEFPKKISYRTEDKKLIAEISDDRKKEIFEFSKANQK